MSVVDDYFKIYRNLIPESELPEIKVLDNAISEYAKECEAMTIQWEQEVNAGLMTEEDFNHMKEYLNNKYQETVLRLVAEFGEIAKNREGELKGRVEQVVRSVVRRAKEELNAKQLIKEAAAAIKEANDVLGRQ